MENLIKYLILWMLIITPLTSCERLIHTRDELIINIDNRLDKEFLVVFDTNIETKQVIVKNKEKTTLDFVNEQMVEVDFMGLSELNDEQMVILLETGLYNISDTTYFKWTEIRENEYEKEIYYEHLSTTHKENSHLNYTSYRNLTIDSTLLPIFKKDYNMLEQFSEYYKKEE